jgi:CRISPR-associated protein Cas8a1/Csx13
MADEQSLTWNLSDPGMDILERAGLAGLYMALQAAAEKGHDLSPLKWELSSTAVTVRWTGQAQPAFQKLIEWAWQVTPDGVLYLPGVHDDNELANFYLRVPTHNGIMGTFFQHNKTQPLDVPVNKVVTLDENREVSVSYRPPNGELKPIHGVEELFDSKGEFKRKALEISSWLLPGAAGRYGKESAWEGSSTLALILLFGPTVCLYQRLQGEGRNWVFVIPDVRDMEDFAITRQRMVLNADFVDVASLGDAGLQFFAEYATKKPRRSISGCRVVAMGKVGFYANQSIRKSVLNVTADSLQVSRYKLLHQQFPNVYVPFRTEALDKTEETSPKKRAMKSKKPAASTNAETPKAKGFYTLPSVRGRIADNLVSGRPWYENLHIPQPWDLEALERQRKRTPGKSVEVLWFQSLCYQRSKLMKLIQEEAMWDSEAEKVFVEAFWETIDSLYAQEAQATERGGSRTVDDRFEDLNDDICRSLIQAKTRTLLRAVLTDLFARAGRQKTIRTYPAAIWRLCDHADHWRKGRDLSLIALASHRKKEQRTATNPNQGA